MAGLSFKLSHSRSSRSRTVADREFLIEENDNFVIENRKKLYLKVEKLFKFNTRLKIRTYC